MSVPRQILFSIQDLFPGSIAMSLFVLLKKIFANAVTREWRKKLEPLKPVNPSWTEQTAEAQVEWELNLADTYTGPQGGSVETGPSSRMKEVTRTATSLATVFLFVMPWSFWNKVSKRSRVCAYEDYVVPVLAEDGKRPKLKQRQKGVEGSRHRAVNEEKSSLSLPCTCWSG